MRIDNEGPTGPRTSPTTGADNDAAVAAAAAAAAEAAAAATAAARDAARGLHDPAHRAAAGWGLADRPVESAPESRATAVADARANARTAMARTDAPEVRTVVERLGNALVDGRIDPHINDTFREHLYRVATEPVGSTAYQGALAQLTRAAEVLARVELAEGSRLAYDPRAGQSEVARAGLPILDVPDIDADLYFRTRDGVLHIENVKSSPGGLAGPVLDSVDEARNPTGRPGQIDRQGVWVDAAPPGAPRQLGFFMLQDGPGFNNLLQTGNVDRLQQLVGGDADARRFLVGDRAYSVNDFRAISAAAAGPANAHVAALRAQHVADGAPVRSFDARAAYNDYYRSTAGSAGEALRRFGADVGEPRPLLTRLPPPELPSIRQGTAFGAAAAGAITLLRVAGDGQLSVADAGEVAAQTAFGGSLGALGAAGERVVTPVVDRVAGSAIQRGASAGYAAVARTATVESAAAFGAGARTLATRVGGATVVGVAISTGVSIYENREGLARGDSQAIGNVTADTAVAATSIAAATAAGAAIGSVVPVAGTAVGAVVGLAVGVGIAYGAQISGARDAMANTVSGWVDGIKGWF